MISTVAVGTDGSETADEAVKQAAEIARRFDAKLVVLSASQDSGPTDAQHEDIELEWARSSTARVTTMLDQLKAELTASGLNVETLGEEGHPADVLVRLAHKCGADLLVVGNRGMKRRVLGSVPNSVTHKADCSVLVVKTT